jgi:hypothetical protein
MEWNSEHFNLPGKGSERNSESFLFRRTAGIPPELTICSVYSVFRGIIFLPEIANPKPYHTTSIKGSDIPYTDLCSTDKRNR